MGKPFFYRRKPCVRGRVCGAIGQTSLSLQHWRRSCFTLLSLSLVFRFIPTLLLLLFLFSLSILLHLFPHLLSLSLVLPLYSPFLFLSLSSPISVKTLHSLYPPFFSPPLPLFPVLPRSLKCTGLSGAPHSQQNPLLSLQSHTRALLCLPPSPA